ncbi:TraK family protein [Xanthomonas perforans]|uniref:TraK family protein n=1 Tax=Xanthomonas perforans TaxID=442694 RepID=UPI000B207CC7|nr:TraK family protein [Xanthomonas perforans]
MGTRYTDELAAWADQKAEKKRRQDAAAVAFLAVRGDVVEAMEAGYALTTIYDHMHETGRVKTSYETFRRHVQRFIKAAPADTAPPTPKAATRSASNSPTTVPAVTPKPAVSAPASPASEQAGKIPSFNFNPTRTKRTCCKPPLMGDEHQGKTVGRPLKCQ